MPQIITGIVKKGIITKELIKRTKKNDIILIAHQDLDQTTATTLINKKIRAVINTKPTITGKFRNIAPQLLLDNNIFLIDCLDDELFTKINEGDKIMIKDGGIYKDGNLLVKGEVITKEIIKEKLELAKENLNTQLQNFVENTLSYLQKEKEILLGDISFPDVDLNFTKRHVLVVTRGHDYQEDLKTLTSYIKEVKPVLIGVDGGADALLEFGYKPDIIIGDMDSVSDKALSCGAKLLVHAYKDGRSPGMERIKKLNLDAITIKLPGLSEDVALLLAYHLGAELIVGVGIHFSLEEFLEKGRLGASSTLLVRLKIGSKLFDAKGVSRLYKSKINISLIIGLLLAALLPIIIVLFTSPILSPFLRLIKILIKKNLGI